jgi:hypothetical protein
MLTAEIDPEVQNNIRTYEDIYSLLMSHPNAKLTFDEFVQLKPEIRRELVVQLLDYMKLMHNGITLYQLFAFDSETRSHMLEKVKQEVTKKSDLSRNFIKSIFSEDPRHTEEIEIYEINRVTVDEEGQLANSDLIMVPKNQLNQANIMTHVSWDASVAGEFRVMQEYWDSFNFNKEFQDYIKKRLELENIKLKLVYKVNWKRHEHAGPNWFLDIVQKMHHLYDFEKIQQLYRDTLGKESIIGIAESSYKYAEIIKINTAYKSKLASATKEFLLWDQFYGGSNQRHKKLQLLLEDYDLLKLTEYIEKELPKKKEPFTEGQFFVKLGACSPKDSALINKNNNGVLGSRSGQEIVQLLITSKRCLNQEFEKEDNEDLNLIVQPFNPDIRAHNRQNEWRLFIWESRIVAVTQQVWHEVFDDNRKNAIHVKRLAKTLQQFNEKSENFIIAAGSTDVYFDPNKSFSLSDFSSEEFKLLMELLNKNNLAELSKKVVEGWLYIIEFNEAEISASGLTSYERDDAFLHGKMPNFEIRLLKNKFMLTPEKICEEVKEIGKNLITDTHRNYLAEIKELEKEVGNISRETIEKFKKNLNALVEGAWENENLRKADQIDRIAQKIWGKIEEIEKELDKIVEETGGRVGKIEFFQSNTLRLSENSSTMFAQLNNEWDPGSAVSDNGIQIDPNIRLEGSSPR